MVCINAYSLVKRVCVEYPLYILSAQTPDWHEIQSVYQRVEREWARVRALLLLTDEQVRRKLQTERNIIRIPQNFVPDRHHLGVRRTRLMVHSIRSNPIPRMKILLQTKSKQLDWTKDKVGDKTFWCAVRWNIPSHRLSRILVSDIAASTHVFLSSP